MKDLMIVPIEIKKFEIIKKKSLTSEDEEDEYLKVDGFAAIYGNIDLGNDRILPNYFREDLKKRGNERPCLWSHKSWDPPIGLNFYSETEEGLFFNALLPMDDSFVKERIFPQLKVGSIKSASIGYTNLKSIFNQTDNCNDLIEGVLHESSLVTFPMNPKALILSVRKQLDNIKHEIKNDYSDVINSNKQFKDYLNIKDENKEIEFLEIKAVPPYKNYAIADKNTKWDKKKAVQDIRDNTNSKEKPSKAYRNGFFYYDSENWDKYTAYKLPYVYWIDGEFKAVPRALYAVVGAIMGARGGVDIPEADISQIKNQINKYYKKMEMEEPFKKKITFIDIETIKGFYKRDYIKLFDDNVVLSTSAKKWIAGIFFARKNEKKENPESSFLNELKQTNQKIKELKI